MALLGIDAGGTFMDAILVEDGGIATARAPTAARQNESMLAAARVVGGLLCQFGCHLAGASASGSSAGR